MRRLARFAVLASLVAGVALGVGCGDDQPKPAASNEGGNVARAGSLGVGDRNAGGETAGGAAANAGGDASLVGMGGMAGEAGADSLGGAPPGVCNQGKGAVITGRVFSPNGALPLGGVSVYVPSSTVDSLPNGAGCWRCDSALNGTPIAVAVTSADGRFEIDNAPVGDKVPLVVQTGKWRRQLELGVVDCQENPASEDDTRLPRKKSEGNLPAIALVSGGEDTLECLLRKLGIADTEFSYTAGNGRVRLFQGKGGIAQFNGVAESTLTPAATLWSDSEALGNFDLVLLGSETDQDAAAKPAGALQAVHAYAATGGRVLIQHFENYFLSAGSNDVAKIATYSQKADIAAPFTASVDETSARGKALADSLLAADPQAARGKVTVAEGRNSVQAVKAPALRLLYADAPATVQAFSLDLPSDGTVPTCGRITETEVLTAAGDMVADFPLGCSSKTLSEQERALAYLIFDLGACLP